MENLRNIDKFDILNIVELNIPFRYKRAIYELGINILKYKEDLDISHLFLFGSCSRSDIRHGSDIDILLLTNSEDEVKLKSLIHNKYLEEDIYGIKPQITVRNKFRYSNIDNNKSTEKFHSIIYNDLKLLWRYNNESNK